MTRTMAWPSLHNPLQKHLHRQGLHQDRKRQHPSHELSRLQLSLSPDSLTSSDVSVNSSASKTLPGRGLKRKSTEIHENRPYFEHPPLGMFLAPSHRYIKLLRPKDLRFCMKWSPLKITIFFTSVDHCLLSFVPENYL